MMMYILIKW